MQDKLRRQVVYMAIMTVQNAPSLPLTLTRRWINRVVEHRTYQGIRIIDLVLGRTVALREEFYTATEEALALIQENDARRFAVVKREIKYIVNEVLSDSFCVYDRVGQRCSVDFRTVEGNMAGQDRGWYIASYASRIVHEATHGRLYSRCIPYTRATRTRIERLCRSEEARFATRLPKGRYDYSVLAEAPDLEDHTILSNKRTGRIARSIQLLKNVRSEMRKGRKDG